MHNEGTIDWGSVPCRPGPTVLEVCAPCGSFRVEDVEVPPSHEVMEGHGGAGRWRSVSECQDCGSFDITKAAVERPQQEGGK
jgi:hypothetical protein